MASHRRGPWSQGEDAYLIQLVHTQGALNWVRIAQLIGSRSPKQCRERYHQNLKPSLNHEPISPEEGLQIERLVAEMGKRWAEIARRLHGRSDNAVKNWWNGSMNRRRRLVVRRRANSPTATNFEERPDGLSYARPPVTSPHPLTISSNISSIRRPHLDSSLPSPSTSDASRADSFEGAPSLVSDSGASNFSTSPRAALSPTIELPPLGGMMSDCRRPSLPTLCLKSNTFLPDSDASPSSFSPRFHSDSKHHSWGSNPLHTPTSRQFEQPTIPDLRQVHPASGPMGIAPPPMSLHLPPFQSLGRPPETRVERDSRMHLSSLLD